MPSFSRKKFMRFLVTGYDRMKAMSRVCQPPKQFSIMQFTHSVECIFTTVGEI